ncbi:MAG TPA: T9SS type A sorting domain-containing protein [Ignavibacteriaceae bacterium]|nr:T9SS type A sorting domain-containing protein [Ignavibacteriaceae bacterium]
MKNFLILFIFISSLVYSQVGWQMLNESIFFLDKNTGWIGTYVNNIGATTIKTTNAGETWEIQKIDSFYYYLAWFYSDSVGLAFPGTPKPYKTTDQGKTWKKNPFGENNLSSIYFFKDGFTGYAVQTILDSSTNTLKKYFSKTIDGGINWDTVSFLGNSNGLKHYIKWVLNSEEIIRQDFSYGRPFYESLYKSSDGGKTWNYIIGFSLGDEGWGGVSGFCFADQKVGYFAFKGEYKTTDGGSTWLRDSNYIGSGTLFVDSIVGFKTGSHKLYRTTDKGVSWDVVFYVGDSSYFSFFTFIDSLNGFAKKYSNKSDEQRITFCKTTDGGFTWNCSPIVFDTSAVITSIQEQPQVVVSKYELSQNYPNPFNPSTNIKFSLPEGGITTIKVYDILGEEKATLLNEYKPAGSYIATFDGKNLPSGVYIYTITSGSFKQSRKMLLMK